MEPPKQVIDSMNIIAREIESLIDLREHFTIFAMQRLVAVGIELQAFNHLVMESYQC